MAAEPKTAPGMLTPPPRPGHRLGNRKERQNGDDPECDVHRLQVRQVGLA